MWYNFGRKHMTLKTTPAIAAGIETKIWMVMDSVEMVARAGQIQTDPLPTSANVIIVRYHQPRQGLQK